MLRTPVTRTITRSLKTTLRLTTTTTRNIRTSAIILNAQPFPMPSLSPTMEQGNIVSWQCKVGDSFSAGDVILQIETDKAQMDVEAQDDGKLAKIILGDGTKDVKVGETIAFIADPEDDLATLEIPKVVAGKGSTAQVQEEEPSSQKTEPAVRVTNSSAAKVQQREANRDQTLLPSVQVLLGENGISREDALAKIPATGPNGRLLKGDVLAYLGKVPNEAVVGIAEYVESSEHLDLSNIQLMKQSEQQQQSATASSETPAKPVASSETGKPASTEAVAQPAKVGPTTINEEIYFNVSQSIPYGRLAASVDSLMKEAFHYSHRMPLNTEVQSDYFDPIFEDLLVVEPRAPRFEYTYELVPAGPTAVGGGPAMNGCNMRRQDAGCNMHRGQGNCGHHAQAGCNMHRGQGNCGHHSQSGCRHHGKAADRSRGYILNLEIKLNDRFADAKGKAERFVSYLEQLELP